MKSLQFRCKLLSDIILNQKSATEGNRTTLEFIPGSNFLGIVAGQLYDEKNAEKSLLMFHTGDVKYGDAHPSVGNVRGLKIPASMYYPKLEDVTKKCYINYLVSDLSSSDIKEMQLKQCRTGFYCFNPQDKVATGVSIEKGFSIKSAYDKDLRRSQDNMMYGYEALKKGMEFLFEVTLSDKAEQHEQEVRNALVGQHRIGRSRTAQYGWVEIEECRYDDVSTSSSVTIKNERYIVVYADSRLVFLDEYGIPTCRPSGDDLGIPGGTIDWSRSQIRTFQYAPWNYKRQAYDTDRCGIEKGSVFLVKPEGAGEPKASSAYIGVYQNEGFGKVIYNPDFLQGDKNGKACYQFKKANSTPKVDSNLPVNMDDASSKLLAYLYIRQEGEELRGRIYGLVNSFTAKNKNRFKEETFASQWGKIRSIAMAGVNVKDEVLEYIGHGIANEKWEKEERKTRLENFMKDVEKEVENVRKETLRLGNEQVKQYIEKNITNSYFQEAIINLASEMAKSCKK